MKNLLYIGHAFHNKTKSSDFILDLLSTKYSIEKFDFDPYCDGMGVFKKLSGLHFDVVILWQIKNARKYIEDGYKEWEKNKYKILDWIEVDVKLNSDELLMDSMLNIKKSKKISLTLLKKKYTRKYIIFYILGLIPIKIPRKQKEYECDI